MKMANYSFNFEKFIMNEHYSTNLLTNIYGKKPIVFEVQTFGIWSLFVLIRFELDRIVCKLSFCNNVTPNEIFYCTFFLGTLSEYQPILSKIKISAIMKYFQTAIS